MITLNSTQFPETTTIRLRNCSRILQHFRSGDELNCRELSVRTELSIPTVSTIVSSLAAQNLLETVDRREVATGRPGKTFRIARNDTQVLCVIIGTGTCSFVAISPDGQVAEETLHVFETPSRTDRLIKEITKGAIAIEMRLGTRVRGIGVVVPGLLDTKRNDPNHNV